MEAIALEQDGLPSQYVVQISHCLLSSRCGLETVSEGSCVVIWPTVIDTHARGDVGNVGF